MNCYPPKSLKYITKSINGNVDYKNNVTVKDENGNIVKSNKKNVRIYGGSRKKLKRIIETDEKIKEILAKIQEVRDNKW